MIRRQRGVTGMLFMGVLIAAGTLGLAIAAWSTDLTINGNVQTGEIDAKLFVFETRDNEDDKDVGQCDALAVDSTKVNVEITNGYPGYECDVLIDVDNNSKIPISVTGDLKANGNGAIELKNFNCEEEQIAGFGVGICDFTINVTKAAEQDTKYEFQVNVCAYLSEVLTGPDFSQRHKCNANTIIVD